MKSTFWRRLSRWASHLVPESVSRWMVRRTTRLFQSEFGAQKTDDFLELLLGAMDLAFRLSSAYRSNIAGFRGSLVFRTADGRVSTSVVLEDGDMRVLEEAIPDPDVTVSFVDVAALWRFLLQGGDVVESVLADEVTVEGNLNYVYRFGFLASDLTRRLGVAA